MPLSSGIYISMECLFNCWNVIIFDNEVDKCLFRNIINFKLLQKSLFLNEKRVLQLGYRRLCEVIKLNVSLQSVQQHGNDESPIHATPPESGQTFWDFH